MKLSGISRVAKQTLKKFIYGTTAIVVGFSGMAVAVPLFLSPLTTQAAVPTNIVINEVSPFSATEWVELYNPTNSSIDISGWRVRHDSQPSNFGGVIASSTSLAAHGYFVLTDSGILPNPGGTLHLCQDNTCASDVDTVAYPGSLTSTQSYGRTYDGASSFQTFSSPTQGADNLTASTTLSSVYVNETTGSDTVGDCTDAYPCTTIAKALTRVSTSGTIYVGAGTYNENVVINKAVTLTGAGADSTRIVATDANHTPLTFATSGATVSGFTITHNYTSSELSTWNFNNNGVAFNQLTSGNTLENSTVSLNRNGIYLNRSSAVIKNNVITNNRTGINLTNTVNGTDIENNQITGNWTLGFVYYSQGYATDFSTLTVSGNSFNNWYSEVEVKDAGTSTGTLDVTNNTFADSPVTYSTSSDASLNEPGFSAQQPVSLGGSASAPASTYPTLRIYNSSSVTLQYSSPKTVEVLAGQSIQSAVDLANAGDTIQLMSDVTTSSRITINKSLSLDGNGFTIHPSFSKTDNSNNSAIGIQHSDVNIMNLTIDGAGGTNLHGINIYVSTGVSLNNVTVANNDRDGIVVNGSSVTVNNITTSGNGWGGIDVDQGSGVTSPAALTVDGTSSQSEAAQIQIDDITKDVSVVDTNHQYSYVTNGNLRIYTLLQADQTAPDGSGNATLDSSTPNVVVSSPTQPVVITVSSGTTNATIDYSSLKTSSTTAVVPQTTINTQNANVQIQAGTTITASSSSWDGTITAPTVQSNTSVTIPTASGTTTTVGTVIEVGANGINLTFDKAARLVIPGQAGKLVGFDRNGNFTQITTACSADSQAVGNSLPAGGDCYISVGSDMVVWTKHFTKFATYTTSNTYVVQAGDTMYSIARKFGLTLAQLEALNPTAGHPAGNFGFILPGDILKVGSAKEITTASAISGGSGSGVLGTQSNTPAAGGQTSSTSTVNPKVAATNNAAAAKKASGLAWYWWVVIVAAALAVGAAYYIYRFAESVDKKS